MRRWGLTCLTSRKAHTATKYVLKLDGWIQKNKSLASTIGIIVGGALALTGVIGPIGLVAWPVITGINAIIAAAGAMGAIFTTVGSAVMTAIGAISWRYLSVNTGSLSAHSLAVWLKG